MKNLMNVTQKFTGLEMEVSYAWEYHLETFWSQNDGPDPQPADLVDGTVDGACWRFR